MASIIAYEVFSEVVEIARSDEPLRKRRAKAEKRLANSRLTLKRQSSWVRHEGGSQKIISLVCWVSENACGVFPIAIRWQSAAGPDISTLLES
jgi:hypothetical protein